MSTRGASESSAAEVPAKAVHYLRPGFTAITPYVIVNGGFIEFLNNAFAGTERRRLPMPDGKLTHAEEAIGNGIVETADAHEQVSPAPTDIHLYVNDADATFDRALGAGATSIYRPTDDLRRSLGRPPRRIWQSLVHRDAKRMDSRARGTA